MTKSVKDRRVSVIVILFLLILAITGIMGFLLRGNFQTRLADGEIPPNVISYPTVKTSVTSSKNGESHSLDIDLYVKYKEGAEKDISYDEAFNKIQQSVSELDYESLKSYDSIAYIKQKVTNDLSEVVGAENISSIYIGNIVIDFPNVIEETSTPVNSVNDKIKGLFNNIK